VDRAWDEATRGELWVVDHVPTAFAVMVAAEAPASIALSGGDTARRCYELLAVAPVDWSRIEVFFGDERWVPVDDPDSNEGMARHTFLDQVESAAVHSLRHAGATPAEAADAYDGRVRNSDPIALVHLGLGADGHVASLFPGTAAMDEQRRLVVPNRDELHPHPRLTFTFPAIARAGLVVFTVAGADKAAALAGVRDGADLPATRVRADRVVWLVDRAAAGESGAANGRA
jgi:6-phosphogluconolactonase